MSLRDTEDRLRRMSIRLQRIEEKLDEMLERDEEEPSGPSEETVKRWIDYVSAHPITAHVAGELRQRGGVGRLLDRLFGPGGGA